MIILITTLTILMILTDWLLNKTSPKSSTFEWIILIVSTLCTILVALSCSVFGLSIGWLAADLIISSLQLTFTFGRLYGTFETKIQQLAQAITAVPAS